MVVETGMQTTGARWAVVIGVSVWHGPGAVFIVTCSFSHAVIVLEDGSLPPPPLSCS